MRVEIEHPSDPAKESSTLLGCPFCGEENPFHSQDTGGDDPQYWNWWIECRNVDCSAYVTGDTEAKCAEIWNKRTSPNSGI